MAEASRAAGLALSSAVNIINWPCLNLSRTPMQIDLTLAVNYVPAALCLLRLLFYLSLMCIFRSGEEIGGYSILALLLWMDRVIFRVYLKNIIFDSSAIILAVFASNVFLLLRSHNTLPHMSFLGAVVNFGYPLSCAQTRDQSNLNMICRWFGSSIYMILEPVHLRKVFEKRARLYHIVPALVTVAALAAQIQVHAPLEDHGIRYFRGISFALLCLVWIYVVGIHQSQALEPLRDNSSHFIARFCPVLYMPQFVAILFAMVASLAMSYQYYNLFMSEKRQDYVPDIEMAHMAQEPLIHKPETLPVIQEEMQEYEEMFRLAKQSRSQ